MKELLIITAIVISFIFAIYYLAVWGCTSHGNFLIKSPSGTIKAIKIVNPGQGRLYYTMKNGTEGMVAGSFSVEEIKNDVE